MPESRPQRPERERPTRLRKPTLVEMIFELRFEPGGEAVGSLLPGLLFAKLGSSYSGSRALPVASLPPELRASDPDLRFQAHFRLEGDRRAIYIGDRVAGVTQVARYSGWNDFQPRILELLDVLKTVRSVHNVKRFSIKAVNIIPQQGNSQLGALRLNVSLADEPVSDKGFSLRLEKNDSAFMRIIEIRPHTTLTHPVAGNREGLLLSLDVIRSTNAKRLWPNADREIESVHQEVRELFFSMLTDETLASLGPDYS